MASMTEDSLPYFVLALDDDAGNYNNNDSHANQGQTNTNITHSSTGYTKAVFTVPKDLVQAIVKYPVLCHGSSFELQIEDGPGSTVFVSTLFCSPQPQHMASELAKRLARRLQHTREQQLSGNKSNNNNDGTTSVWQTMLGL